MRPSAAAGMWTCSPETTFKAAAEVNQKALSLKTDYFYQPHKSQTCNVGGNTFKLFRGYKYKHTEKNLCWKEMEQRWCFAIKHESELCEYAALWQTKQAKNTSRFIF